MDACLFNGEEDMLRLRLLTLRDVVDLFVVVACARTHQGQPLERHPVETAAHRAWIAAGVRDMRLGWCEPSMVLNRGQGVVLERSPRERGPVRTPWFQHIEKQHRNYVKTFVQELPGTRDAVVMISDVDEIPNPAAVRRFTDGYPQPANAQRAAYCLEQRFHSGALNVLHPYQPWLGTTISRQRDMAPQVHRDLRTTAYNEIPEIELIPDGGWHLSWLGTDAERARKLDTFSHAELRGKYDPAKGRANDLHSNGERLHRMTITEQYEATWPRPLLDGSFRPPDYWLTDNAWENA